MESSSSSSSIQFPIDFQTTASDVSILRMDGFEIIHWFPSNGKLYLNLYHYFVTHDKDSRILDADGKKYRSRQLSSTVIYPPKKHILRSMSSCLIVERWWIHNYGHTHDELYTSYYVSRKLNLESLIPYGVHLNPPLFAIAPLLFTSTELGMLSLQSSHPHEHVWIELSEIYVVKNNTTDYAFHRFPMSVSDTILSKTLQREIERSIPLLLLTRTASSHRSINMSFVDQWATSHQIPILNPETFPMISLIRHLYRANTIIITWGSALTNLCYCRNHTKIIVLKPFSYGNEPFGYFQKIINQRKLQVLAILDSSPENQYDWNDLERWIMF